MQDETTRPRGMERAIVKELAGPRVAPADRAQKPALSPSEQCLLARQAPVGGVVRAHEHPYFDERHHTTFVGLAYRARELHADEVGAVATFET